MPETHPIRCRCGKFHAELADPKHSTHAVCYKINPFFDGASNQPIVPPRELTPQELDDLKRRVGRN